MSTNIVSQQPQQLEQKRQKSLIAALVVVIVIVAVLAIIGFLFLKEPPVIIEGQAEATAVTVSGKLPGRVVEIYVEEGQDVHAGDTLVHIHSSLADAKLRQAEGMETVARSQNQKVDAGTRVQIVNAARDLWQQASAAVSIAQKTYNRLERLYNEGVVSEQKRDEAKAAYDAAVSGEKAARSQYELAKSGAQSEDKQAAAAMVSVAQGGVAEVEALLQDQYLTAPCDGQVQDVYPHVGELVSIGTPVMSILKLEDKWLTFNVREQFLNDMKMGSEIEVMIPALDKKTAKARIYYVSNLGTYAVWSSTKSTGQWDSRTFKIKARPVDSIPDLRPGMSVVIKK